MPNLALWATRTHSHLDIYYENYFAQNESHREPVPVQLQVWHDENTDTLTVRSILLYTLNIDPDFISTEPAEDGGTVLRFVSHVFNLRYLEGLRIQLTETRGGSPVTAETEVLDHEREPGLISGRMPNNPVRPEEFEENVPRENMVGLGINQSVVSERYPTVIESALQSISSPERIEEVHSGSEDEEDVNICFETEPENIPPTTFRYAEDPAVNFCLNPSQQVTDYSSGVVSPKYFRVGAPGFSITTKMLPGSVPGTSIRRISAANPNPYNTYDRLVLDFGRSVVPLGTKSWTFSFYHTLECTLPVLPFQTASIVFAFFDDSGGFLGSEGVSVPVRLTTTFSLLSATVEETKIPANTTVVNPSVSFGPADDSFTFFPSIYLPQLESTGAPTSRTLTSRATPDVWQAPSAVTLVPPLYVALETVHRNLPTIRGILDTTTALRDGIQFYVADNRMFLKRLSPTGQVVFSLVSAPFAAADGDTVTYGFFSNGSLVSFYINGTLINSVSQLLVLNQNVTPKVGSLVSSGSALGTPISRFGIFRVAPS